MQSEGARACHDLAFAEVISYNKANLERMEQNADSGTDNRLSAGQLAGLSEERKN